MPEARELAKDRMQEVAEMPFQNVLRLVEQPVEREITAPSGRTYRVKTYAFWDMEPYESDLYIRTKVTGQGPRFLQRYYGVETRGPDSDFACGQDREPVVAATWAEMLAWTLFALVIVAILAGLIIGLVFLIDLVFLIVKVP